MPHLNFTIIQPWHRKSQMLIANWYLAEWNIPFSKTINRFEQIVLKTDQFQVLMHLDDKPIATGGVYNNITLLEMEPFLKNYKKWLAQIFISPGYRGRGYGTALCSYIHQHAAAKDIDKLHLATSSGTAFYQKLGWHTKDTLQVAGKNITIMEKGLHEEQKILNHFLYEQNNY